MTEFSAVLVAAPGPRKPLASSEGFPVASALLGAAHPVDSRSGHHAMTPTPPLLGSSLAFPITGLKEPGNALVFLV